MIQWWYKIYSNIDASGRSFGGIMKKNVSQLLSWGVTIFGALCGIVAFCMVFATAVKTPYFLKESFSGLQVALGCSVNDHVIFKASAGLILSFVFPILAACVAIVGKGNKIVAVAAGALMVTGGALSLSTLNLLNQPVYIGACELAAGPIVAGIFSLIGGVTLLASLVVDGVLAKK